MFHGFLLPRGPRSSQSTTRATRIGRPTVQPDELAHRVTVRLAEPGDTRALQRLAGLDSARMPEGTLVVGELGGAIQAAVPVSGGRPIANPFVRTAELVRLLELRAGQLRELGLGEPESARVIALPRRRPRLADSAA